MTSVKGILKISDIGMGGFILQTTDGAKYSLHGDIPSRLIDHLVEVKGRKVVSTMMIGQALEVISIKALPPSRSHQQK